jgi:hypothetical protein
VLGNLQFVLMTGKFILLRHRDPGKRH